MSLKNKKKQPIFQKILLRLRLDKNYNSNQAFEQQDTGFSLLELIVVVLIIGALAGIIAPSWLTFVNRQKVNKANDIILAALQEAQRQAKIKKLSYSVSFQTKHEIPQIAVYPMVSQDTTPSNWRDLGAELGIKSGQLLLGTNLKTSQANTANTSITYASTTPVTITFDYMGTVPSFGSPLKVLVAVPKAGSTTQPSDTKRCVILATLIGGMRTDKDSNCDK